MAEYIAMNEEEQQIQQRIDANRNRKRGKAYIRIPYALLRDEVKYSSEVFEEMAEIISKYKVYENGMMFHPEGSLNDYVPSMLRFKKAASLIGKEARFLFGETPDMLIQPKGDAGKVSQDVKDNITNMQSLIASVLDGSMFSLKLLQAAKDCFIGKRVACCVNFNELTGITVSFLNALSFVYDTDPLDPFRITRFVSIVPLNKAKMQEDRRWHKKVYQMEPDGMCWESEGIYNGSGMLIDDMMEYQPTKLKSIPAVVIVNDGLLGDDDGESEIDTLCDYEEVYSKLANADVDAERKGMNQIKYTVNMSPESTEGLKTSPGAFWDLHADQNSDNGSPVVGTIDANMAYSEALTTTLNRIETNMHNLLDVPNISVETMQSIITSGKALKAVYWPLIVRCKEKMKTWGPQLERVMGIIIEGALAYPNTTKKYLVDSILPAEIEFHVLTNYPLPEDEDEEKSSDLSEVNSQAMSRKAYMMKWRELTEDEADDEIDQIVLESQLLDGQSMMDLGAGGAAALEEADDGSAGVVDETMVDNVEEVLGGEE